MKIQLPVSATLLLVVLGMSMQGCNFPSDPRQELDAVITEGIHLLETEDDVSFLRNLLPPPERLLEKRSLEEIAVGFRERKAEAILSMLRATEGISPIMGSDVQSATYKLPKQFANMNQISFKKSVRGWIIDASVSVRQTEKLKTGSVVPDFTLMTLKERRIQLSQLRGKVVVLHFWAPWCGPCLRQMPKHIQQLSQYSPDDLEVVFVCKDGNQEQFVSMVEEHGMPFNNIIAPDGWADFGVEHLPYDIVIGRDGKVASNSIEDLDDLLPSTNFPPDA